MSAAALIQAAPTSDDAILRPQHLANWLSTLVSFNFFEFFL
jgi:hypothetical protein